MKSYDELADYGPSKPKIKGIDYEYLKGMVEEAFSLKFKSRLIGKIMRFIYIRTKRKKIRYLFVWLYCKWVAFTSKH